MKRTDQLRAGASLLLLLGSWLGAGEDTKFDFSILRDRARKLAATPHRPPRGEVPEWLQQLTYDELRLIEFGGQNSLWLAERRPFLVQFLHPGFIFDRMVHLSEVHEGTARLIPFRPEHFNYRSVQPGPMPATMGFAGFRLMFPFGGPGTRHNEIGSFVGASYFRLLGSGAAYGLSARGLAIDTAGDKPEEFPIFTEFWLERPAPRATSLTFFALLESESATGAYQFVVTPGESTVVHVKAVVFCRRNPALLGLAPLTSMFWHAENTATSRDYRPEVHDSDGLLMHNGAGEWIWRPLVNRRHLRTSSFTDENPRAFGLVQRDRDFENYQDLEASYHLRPSAWIEPIGRWGRGAVRLVEIPTGRETDDNIVALWVPEKLPEPGQPIEFEYRMHWYTDRVASPAGSVRSTRHGKSAHYEPGFERFVVDFEGRQLMALTAAARIEQVVTVHGGGKLNHSSLQKNPINGTWRVAFTVKPDGTGKPVELRCFLRQGPDSLTETWSYLWEP